MLNLVDTILELIIILLTLCFIYSIIKTQILIKKLELKIEEHFKSIPQKK
ncbi:hypothetical protein N581_09085 [Lactobacillus jensenii MD IIE-70(2)]|nr:hypothetical protein N581_09085 [Lactobacillus jensenii MD IIE-70(2)]